MWRHLLLKILVSILILQLPQQPASVAACGEMGAINRHCLYFITGSPSPATPYYSPPTHNPSSPPPPSSSPNFPLFFPVPLFPSSPPFQPSSNFSSNLNQPGVLSLLLSSPLSSFQNFSPPLPRPNVHICHVSQLFLRFASFISFDRSSCVMMP